MRKLKSYTAITFSTTILNFALRLLRGSVLARLLGPTNRGIFGLFSAVPGILNDLGSLGFELGSTILVTRRKASLKSTLGNSIIFSFSSSLILMGIGYTMLSEKYLLHDNPEVIRSYLFLVLLSIPLEMLEKQGKNLLLSIEKVKEYNALRLYVPLATLVFFIAIYFLTRNSLLAAVVGWLGGYVTGDIWLYSSLWKAAGKRISFSWSEFRECIAYGTRGYFSTLSDELLSKLDFFLIGYFLGAREVGYYAISVAVVDIILQVVGAFNTSLLPLRMNSPDADGRTIIPRVSRYLNFSVCIICLYAVFFGKPFIVVLFGASFLPGYLAMVWLLPGVVFRSLYRVLKIEMYSAERLGIVSIASLVALLVNVVANLVLIPWMGIVGASVSTSLANFIAAAMLLTLYRSRHNLTYREILVIKREEFVKFLKYPVHIGKF